MILTVPRRGRADSASGCIAPWTFPRKVILTIAFIKPIPDSSATIEPIQRQAVSPYFIAALSRHPIPLSVFIPVLRAASDSGSLSLPTASATSAATTAS